MKLRPFTGRSCTAFSVTSELDGRRVGLHAAAILAATVIVLGHGADLQLHVDAGAVAGRQRDARVWVPNPCSSIFTVYVPIGNSVTR